MTAFSLAVDCRQLTKDFGEGETLVKALRGINFTAALGEMTLLVGPSGCGKTTLISIITGILNLTTGSIDVLGTNLSQLTTSQRILFRRKDIGFVFQQYNLIPSLTALENVATPLLAAGISWKEALERSAAVLYELGLSERLYVYPRTLSGGEQQRVAIARALVHEPRLIVCDEPTSALDAQTGQKVMELLSSKALNADRSIIVVTHDERIFAFANRIAHMEDGIITRME